MDFSGSKYGDHSGATSKWYVTHRPGYPQTMYDAIIAYHKESSKAGFNLAVDVGCGSGQATVPLAGYFQKVIGVDISKDQLELAPKNLPNVSYKVAQAEDMAFLHDVSVDMVTVGTAMHWLDIELFMKEVDRVLKPGGSFVAFSNFCVPGFENKEANECIQRFVYNHMTKYYGADRVIFGQGLHSLVTPFKDRKRRDDIEISVDWTVDELIGFVKSLSWADDVVKDNQDQDVFAELKNKLTSLLCDQETGNAEGKHRVIFEMCLTMFRKAV